MIFFFLVFCNFILFFFFFFFFLFFLFCFIFFFFFFFFFQAEDGIRDLYVTGVQTCALPISDPRLRRRPARRRGEPPARVRALVHRGPARPRAGPDAEQPATLLARSEERRVGKECRSRWSP